MLKPDDKVRVNEEQDPRWWGPSIVIRKTEKKVIVTDENNTKPFGISQLIPSRPFTYDLGLQRLLLGIQMYMQGCTSKVFLMEFVEFSDPTAQFEGSDSLALQSKTNLLQKRACIIEVSCAELDSHLNTLNSIFLIILKTVGALQERS